MYVFVCAYVVWNIQIKISLGNREKRPSFDCATTRRFLTCWKASISSEWTRFSFSIGSFVPVFNKKKTYSIQQFKFQTSRHFSNLFLLMFLIKSLKCFVKTVLLVCVNEMTCLWKEVLTFFFVNIKLRKRKSKIVLCL